MFNYQKIITITPERLGDTLFCTPALRLLKSAHDNVQLDVIAASALSASVLVNNPSVNRVLVAPSQETLQALIGYYDLGINLHDSDIARDYFAKLNVDVVHLPKLQMDMHRAEELLQFVGSVIERDISHFDRQYNLAPKAEDVAVIDDVLREHGVDHESDKLIGLHLGCHGLARKHTRIWCRSKHRKAWPIKKFITLAQRLMATDPHIRMVITGSKEEASLGEKFMRKCPRAINLINRTSILQLAALMKKLKCYVVADTGALHVACATDVNLITMFGETSATRTGPYPLQANRVVLQEPVLAKLSVDNVFQHVIQVL